MSWFRRTNRVVEDVPELRDYYAQRQESHNVGWLMALGTLLITVVVALAVFMGGKWIYDRIAGNDDSPSVTISTNDGEFDGQIREENIADGEPTTTSTSQSGQNSTGSVAITPQTSSTSSSTPNTPSTTSSSGQQSGSATTQGASTEIPNTGAGSVALLFIVTAFVAATGREIFAYARSRK